MTESYVAGTTATLTASWSTYAGGPAIDVTGQTITIKTAAGVTVVAATAVGITHLATGLYSYAWAIPEATAAGSYVAIWDATDATPEAVQASEVFAVEAPTGDIGDPYITAAQLKTRLGISDSIDDTAAAEAVLAASRAIETYCDRQFHQLTTATARLFCPDSCALLRVPDFWTSTDLVIKSDTAGDGTYATTWAATDYQLEPLDGAVGGELGWPYSRIRAVGNYSFPVLTVTQYTRAPMLITAKWGWSAVPAGVLSASYLLGADYLALKDARYGLTGGTGDFGPWLVRQNKSAMALLAPYVRMPVLVG